MQVQTTSSFVAKSQVANQLEPLIADQNNQLIISADLARALGLSAPTHLIQGTHVAAASCSTLPKLSESERKTMEKAFDQFKKGALDEAKKLHPQSSGELLGAKILLGTAEHFAPWADPNQQSAIPILLEVATLVPDVIAALKPIFPSLEKIVPFGRFVGVAAQVGEKVAVYRLEHPTP